MRRIGLALIAAFAMALIALPCTAFAESMTGQGNWTVTFNADEKLVDNCSAQQWADDIGKLEPGDDITFTVTLQHQHETACDWYMANEVLKSLEAGIAEGSAYGYLLTYTNPSGKDRVLYDSKTIGGDSSEGLKEATDAMDDFFYLDTLSKGQTAKVTLKVSLNGETEGNAYFDTLAQLKMKFGVELRPEKSTKGNPTNNTVVKTGDDTKLLPYYVIMAVSGALLLALALYALKLRRDDRKEGAR